jgi:hypothetical protein
MAEEQKEEETIYEKIDLGYVKLPSREQWEDNMSEDEKLDFVTGIIKAMTAGKAKS